MVQETSGILLINPWIYDFTAYNFWSKPLGLLYVASMLREAGYHIDFIDCMDNCDPELQKENLLEDCRLPKINEDGSGKFYKEKITKPEILKQIPRNYSRYGMPENIFRRKLSNIRRPLAIFVTSIMTYWYPGVFRAIEIVKEFFPNCPVILGGIYAKLCYQHALSFSNADIVIRDFKISTLQTILKYIDNKIKKEIFSFEKNKCKNCEKHLNDCPYPAWDLYHALDYVCLITTKGCPFRCSYCASYLINPVLQFREPEMVAREISYWKEKRGIRRFVFYDDALLLNANKHFIPVMKSLKRNKLNINFYTPNALHARMITPAVAKQMIENGFKKIWLGFETSDSDLQIRTGGKIDNRGFVRAVKTLLREGFLRKQINAYILIGLPGQSFKSMNESIKFVINTGVKPYLAKFSPIPGTKIWSQAIREYKWEEPVDPLFHNDALMPYFSPSINPKQYNQLKMLIKNNT